MTAEEELKELKEVVIESLASRPHLVKDAYVWLTERGWEQQDVPSSIRWKNPHNGHLYGVSEAMHLERLLIRERMKTLVDFDEDSIKQSRKNLKEKLKEESQRYQAFKQAERDMKQVALHGKISDEESSG